MEESIVEMGDMFQACSRHVREGLKLFDGCASMWYHLVTAVGYLTAKGITGSI